MAAPISGTDLGVPWPPVTNPNVVGGASAVGSTLYALPVGPPPPMATTPSIPPLTVHRPLNTKGGTKEIVVPTTVGAPAGLEVDPGRVVTDGVVSRGIAAFAATPQASAPAGLEVDSGSVVIDGERSGVGV